MLFNQGHVLGLHENLCYLKPLKIKMYIKQKFYTNIGSNLTNHFCKLETKKSIPFDKNLYYNLSKKWK